MSHSSQPNLEAPGAGLPLPELYIARLIFRREVQKSTREKAIAKVESERERFLAFLGDNAGKPFGTQVLIPRLRGLEDSSRYWSVYMTVEHVSIVNESIASAIELMVDGKSPENEASTAAVKPSPEADSSVVERFRVSAGHLLEVAGNQPDLTKGALYSHPWFGPLDPMGWLVMAEFHMQLHRRQLSAIVGRL